MLSGPCLPPGDAEEEEMPDVEIDIDDLLDAANEEERALKLQHRIRTERFLFQSLKFLEGR
uniref:Uncharacterized protein n=1 Tax=Pavo cristatus TaxID=9049 RepID=A0A8C9G805_PAVCR